MTRGQGGHTRVAESERTGSHLGESDVTGTENVDPSSAFYSDSDHRAGLCDTLRDTEKEPWHICSKMKGTQTKVTNVCGVLY